MAHMIRKQIYIKPAQNAALKQLASQSGVPEAELIRDAIDQHLHGVLRVRSDLTVWEEELAFLNDLLQQPAPSSPRTWQRHELYER